MKVHFAIRLSSALLSWTELSQPDSSLTYLCRSLSNMDPLSIVAASFTLASSITKTTIAVARFSLDVHDASEDLDAISKELQTLSTLLGPLGNSLLRHGNAKEPSFCVLLGQIHDTVSGCRDVVTKIEATIVKYASRDTLWARMKWAMFGRDQTHKLRSSLESYKIALSIGLHVISM